MTAAARSSLAMITSRRSPQTATWLLFGPCQARRIREAIFVNFSASSSFSFMRSSHPSCWAAWAHRQAVRSMLRLRVGGDSFGRGGRQSAAVGHQ